MIIFNAVFATHSEKVRLRGHIINGRVISLLIVDKIDPRLLKQTTRDEWNGTSR